VRGEIFLDNHGANICRQRVKQEIVCDDQNIAFLTSSSCCLTGIVRGTRSAGRPLGRHKPLF
jgi:hypothetical protein